MWKQVMGGSRLGDYSLDMSGGTGSGGFNGVSPFAAASPPGSDMASRHTSGRNPPDSDRSGLNAVIDTLKERSLHPEFTGQVSPISSNHRIFRSCRPPCQGQFSQLLGGGTGYGVWCMGYGVWEGGMGMAWL